MRKRENTVLLKAQWCSDSGIALSSFGFGFFFVQAKKKGNKRKTTKDSKKN
jgi:hypothetical protein